MDPALVGVLGTLAGTGVGLAGATALSRDERRDDRQVERRQIFARFLAATYSVVAELRELPPGSEGSVLAKIIDQIQGEDAAYVRTRKELAKMGNTHFTRLDRMNASIAEIQVSDLPAEVVNIVNETGEYVQRLSDERTDEVKAEWPAIAKRLQEATNLLRSERGVKHED